MAKTIIQTKVIMAISGGSSEFLCSCYIPNEKKMRDNFLHSQIAMSKVIFVTITGLIAAYFLPHDFDEASNFLLVIVSIVIL